MSMAQLQLYRNPYNYPDYGNITTYGSDKPCTPVGTGLKTGTLRVEGTQSDFMNCNYLGLTRDGKTFYAWIEEVNYLNDRVYEVTYKVDPWRTYRNDVTLGTQFIERSTKKTYK